MHIKTVLPSQHAFNDSWHSKTNGPELPFSLCPRPTSSALWLIPNTPAPWSSPAETVTRAPVRAYFIETGSHAPSSPARPQPLARHELPHYPACSPYLVFSSSGAVENISLYFLAVGQPLAWPPFILYFFKLSLLTYNLLFFLHYVHIMLTGITKVANIFFLSAY